MHFIIRKSNPAGDPRDFKMKSDYLKFVQWSEEDRVYVGYCPDLFVGGICHGKDENKVYAELSRLVIDDMAQRRSAKAPLPPRQSIVAMPIAA